MQRKIIKSLLITLSAVICTSSACVYALNEEDYTLTKLNDYISMYHITSDVQSDAGIKGGEGAQLVFSMDMSHQDSNKMLLANDTVGIYRSDDNGKSWQVSSEGLEWTTVNTVQFDIDDDNIAYAAVATSSDSSNRTNKYKNTGLYKSVDGGKTWVHKLVLCNEKEYTKLIASGNKNSDGNRVIYSAASNASDYTGLTQGYTGVWKSTDKGETWSNTGLSDRSVNTIYSDTETSLTIVASDKGIDVSYDNGETWIQKNSGLENTMATAVAVNPLNKNHWIIGVQNNGMEMWQTQNSGDTWTKINMKAFGTDVSYISNLEFAIMEGKETPRLFINGVKCAEPNRYSDDFGVTIITPKYNVSSTYGLLEEYSGYYPTAFCINPNNSMEVFTSKITPYKSNDGGESFSFSGSGYSGGLASDWHFDENGAVKYISIADLAFVKMKESDNTLFPIADKIIKSKPADTTVEVDGETKTVSWHSSSTSVAVDPYNSNHGFITLGGYIYSTSSTIMETFDGFETFTEFSDINEKVVAEKKDLSFVKYNPDNSNVIYTDWFVSDNNGQSWREVTYPIKGVSSNNGNTVYSLYDCKIYKSTDCGVTWVDTGLSLPQNTINKCNAFVPDMFYEDVIWVGTYSDIFRIDIVNEKVEKITSFKGRHSTSLEIMGMAQNPMLKNHFIISTRDYYAGGFYVYETYDYGRNFSLITEIPYYAGTGDIEFHPSEKFVFLGTPMGTLVYSWEGRKYSTKKSLKTAYYDNYAREFEISGNAGNNNIIAPVTLVLENETGEAEFVYFDYTNEFGDFGFVCKDIPESSGSYIARISMMDNENMFTYQFNTDTYSSNTSTSVPSAIYDTASKNLVIFGNANYDNCESVTIILKKKDADMKVVDEFNINDSVAYIGESPVLSDNTFVHKFKFDSENESLFDYEISVYADGICFENINIQIIQNGIMCVDLSISDGNGNNLVLADAESFNAAAHIKYFFEDKLKLTLVVSCFEGDRLINVFSAEKNFNYFSEEFSFSENIPENTDKVKLLLLSDFETLKPYAEKIEISDSIPH